MFAYTKTQPLKKFVPDDLDFFVVQIIETKETEDSISDSYTPQFKLETNAHDNGQHDLEKLAHFRAQYFLRPSQLPENTRSILWYAQELVLVPEMERMLTTIDLESRSCAVLPLEVFVSDFVTGVHTADTFLCTRLFDLLNGSFLPCSPFISGLKLKPRNISADTNPSRVSKKRCRPNKRRKSILLRSGQSKQQQHLEPKLENLKQNWTTEDVLYFIRAQHCDHLAPPLVIAGIPVKALTTDICELKGSSFSAVNKSERRTQMDVGLTDIDQQCNHTDLSSSTAVQRRQPKSLQDQKEPFFCLNDRTDAGLPGQPQPKLKTTPQTTANRRDGKKQESIDVLDYHDASLDTSQQSTGEPSRKKTSSHPVNLFSSLKQNTINPPRSLMIRQQNSKNIISSNNASSIDVDEYFAEHYTSATKTSNNTLARLALTKMSEGEVWSLAKSSQDVFENYREVIHQQLYTNFPIWWQQLKAGFNLLFYGAGSKKALLAEFAEMYLLDYCVITINGYFPSLNIKQILNDITSNVMRATAAPRDIVDHAKAIQVYYEVEDNVPELFMLIHNLDGVKMRANSTQDAISILAATPRIHILASIDHINSPILWDYSTLARFNFIWHNASTHCSYDKETSYTETLVLRTPQLKIE
eukprot:gene621-3931_t